MNGVIMTDKVKVATVSLAGCFGCHMSLLDIDERIVQLAGHPLAAYRYKALHRLRYRFDRGRGVQLGKCSYTAGIPQALQDSGGCRRLRH